MSLVPDRFEKFSFDRVRLAGTNEGCQLGLSLAPPNIGRPQDPFAGPEGGVTRRPNVGPSPQSVFIPHDDRP
jgi:hypothetical protein